MFHVKRKNGREEFKARNIEAARCFEYQSVDLKRFWNWFGISDLCKDFCKNFGF